MSAPGRVVEYVRPWMYPKQLEAMFCPERYGLIEASTKAGKTTSALLWLAEQTMKSVAGRNFWWVAPVSAQARIAFRRLNRGLPKGIHTPNKSEMSITLGNGAVIWFKSGDKPDSLYGEDVYACVIDEASRVKEDAWHAVRSTLTATRAAVRMIGNVRGRRNWFFKLCRKAEAGEAGMHYAKLTAADAVAAGVLSAAEVEDARIQYPPEIFRELFFAEPGDDQGNPFGIVAIEKCVVPGLSHLPVEVWGVDLAKSVDWTWAIGLDVNGNVAVSERWQAPWGVTRARLVALIGDTPALVDSTGVGDPIVEDLQKDCSQVEGFKFTSQSKQQLMEGLRSDIHQGLTHFPDGILRKELESYEYEYTAHGVKYDAPEGVHDDGVCALALARKKAKESVYSVTSALI